MLKCACILRCCEKSCDEDEQGSRLYCGAIIGIQQIEKEIHIYFATEDCAGWWVEEEQALEI